MVEVCGRLLSCPNLLAACARQGWGSPHTELEYHAVSIDDAYERRREIGRRVARWRARRGLNRRQFADLCDRSLSWVDKVESGERGLLRLPMLERVAEVLHVSVETLTDTTEVRQARHCLDLFEISAVRAALLDFLIFSCEPGGSATRARSATADMAVAGGAVSGGVGGCRRVALIFGG